MKFTFALSLVVALSGYGLSSRGAVSGFSHVLDDWNGAVMVVAHRACWKNAPENSVEAIEDCIAMGADMVEIDVRRTAGGELILMHDKTLDRMTEAQGRVDEFSLSELKKLFLKNGAGGEHKKLTAARIPTLREGLLAAKDRILVNLDAKDDIRDQALREVQALGMERQVVIKMVAAPDDERLKTMKFIGRTHYMPVIWESGTPLSQLSQAYSGYGPVAYEIVFQNDGYLREGVAAIQEERARLWVNTMYPNLCGNRDEKSHSADMSWGYFIDMGVDMIQTDRPGELIEYLSGKGLR